MIIDKQGQTLVYQIDSNQTDVNDDNSDKELQTIGQLFSLIETNKESLNIETYLLSQTTLEQIFLSFANNTK